MNRKEAYMAQRRHRGGSRVPEVPREAPPGRVSRRQLIQGAAGATAGLTAGSALASAPAGATASSAARFIRSVDVAIVGAGISGLYAADLLSHEPRTSFAVIEARGRTGGRILNASIGVRKQVVEAGAEFIGAQDRLLRRLVIRDLKLPIYDTFGDKNGQGAAIVDFGKPTAITPFSWPLVPPEIVVETALMVKAVDEMASQVDLNNPTRAVQAAAWDTETFETWLQTNIESPDVRAVARLSGYGLFGAEPGDASLLQFMFSLRAHGGVVATGGITGGSQQNRVRGGSQLITNSLVNRIGAENVILNAPVRAIDQTGRRVVITTDAGRVQAGVVILAIPPTYAGAIDYQPQMPILRAQLTQRFPMGYAVKVHATYAKPFWRHLTTKYEDTPDGLSGIVLSKNGPVTLGFDNSPGGAKASTGVLLGFVFGDNGRVWGSKPAATRRAEVLAQFVRWFGQRAGKPIHYMEQNWAAQRWTRGYIGYPTTGTWIDYQRAFTSNIGRIILAGTETAGEGSGGMEGALDAAARAVEQARG
jgi:monoamine oxidase